MRGGVTVNDLMYIYSFEDREAIYKVIKENIDSSVKNQMPLL
jgi:hypothetical protein